jgi:hypothetical protein
MSWPFIDLARPLREGFAPKVTWISRSWGESLFSSYARLNEERRALLDQIQRDGVIHAR